MRACVCVCVLYDSRLNCLYRPETTTTTASVAAHSKCSISERLFITCMLNTLWLKVKLKAFPPTSFPFSMFCLPAHHHLNPTFSFYIFSSASFPICLATDSVHHQFVVVVFVFFCSFPCLVLSVLLCMCVCVFFAIRILCVCVCPNFCFDSFWLRNRLKLYTHSRSMLCVWWRCERSNDVCAWKHK